MPPKQHNPEGGVPRPEELIFQDARRVHANHPGMDFAEARSLVAQPLDLLDRILNDPSDDKMAYLLTGVCELAPMLEEIMQFCTHLHSEGRILAGQVRWFWTR